MGIVYNLGLKTCFTLQVAEAQALRCENCGGSLGYPPLPQECHIISCCGRVSLARARGRVVSNFFVHEIRKQVKLKKNVPNFLNMKAISTAPYDDLNDKKMSN